MHTDPPLPTVFTTAQALASGMTRHMVTGRLRSGRWRRLRVGIYCTAATWSAADARRRHVMMAWAAVRSRSGRGVISHVSAAALYGWPLPLDVPTTVSLTAASLHESTRSLEGLVVQVASLRDADVCRYRGLRVTAPARTVADCLRHLPAADAVAIADDALARGALTAEQLVEVVMQQETWPYAAKALRALPLIDPRRESWLESFSFVRLSEQGVELPEPQVEVLDARGRFVARVDGAWRKYGTVCEADGRGKYLKLLDPQAPADARRVAGAVLTEKQREDALRSTGLEVVRWGTRDVVRDLPEVVARVHDAWGRGDPGRFRGTFRQPKPWSMLTPERFSALESPPQPAWREQAGGQ